MTLRIDAHQHFWTLKRGDYGWLTSDLGTIFRDFAPADLIPLLMRNGIDKTVLVQAAPTESETHFLLGIAEVTPFVAGVVGWTGGATGAGTTQCGFPIQSGMTGRVSGMTKGVSGMTKDVSGMTGGVPVLAAPICHSRA